MKIFLPIVLLLLTGCFYKIPPLDKTEIEALTAERFEEIKLVPAVEIDYLRFDLIRQTFEEEVNDSTTETHNMPYHPLGFDLGNGLFYDLNDNLSLRIDYLYPIEKGDDYTLKKTLNGQDEKNATYRRREKEEICFDWKGWFSGKDRTNCSTIKKVADGIERYTATGRLHYKIVDNQEQKQIFWGKRKREGEAIEKEGVDKFVVKNKRWNDEYLIQEGAVLMDNLYLIKLNESAEELSIYRKGRKEDFLIYSMKKSQDQYLIFNNNYYGYKIEQGDGHLTFYSNKRKWYELELMD